jgi:8-amino-3,8-dideoxy-alpha-D-manno-octulosonate transaminase
MKETLALRGGSPVRTWPLAPHFIGANLVGHEELELVTEVIKTKSLFRHYGPGSPHMVEDFENEAARFFGVRYALATATGSGSYSCALAGLGIGPGDEVIIPSFGWYTDFTAVAMSGALPVFADVDESLNLDPEAFERKITPRTKAVILIYYQGGAGRVDEVLAIARRNGVKVIEDVAQACGGTYNGKKLATFGDAACFSLQGNKVITSGDGGLLLTNDQETYERAVRLHDLGTIRPVFQKRLEGPVMSTPFAGLQWRMNELTGAVALAQVRKLPAIVEKTRALAGRFRSEVSVGFPDVKWRAVQPENDIGIACFMDLGTPEKADFFSEAYKAEGLLPGPTSSCGVLADFDVISRARMPHPGLPPFGKGFAGEGYAPDPEDFRTAREVSRRMAGIAMVPVYTDGDLDDIIRGTLKVLSWMDL